MKKISLSIATFALCLFANTVKAQVSDVSFIITPTLGYTHWNSQLNLGNTGTYGARVGFGFGPILEIRGNYERSFNLKSTLDNVGWSTARHLAGHIEDAKVRYERWGGDIKINLWNNTIFTPYLLGGMGVLKFNYNDAANSATRIREEKLYGNLGAGVKVNLARRVAFSLELRDMLFNVSPTSQYALLNRDKTLSNWNAMASLDIYLGGAQYAKDEVTRAYRQAFGSGFRGLHFAVEPSTAYLNFRERALYRDTWMLGLSAGIDFTQLIGLRGFYYRSCHNADKFSFNTNNDLAIYGANLITRLNVGRGVTPYLSLGAGYLNADKNYQDRNDATGTTKNGWFALGGVGLDYSLHRYVSLFGAVEAMFLNKDNPGLSQISDPAKVNVNRMYRFGLRIHLGRANRPASEIYQRYVDAQVPRTTTVDTSLVAHERDTATRFTQQNDTLPKMILISPAQLNTLVERVISEADRQTRQSGAATSQKMSELDKIILISALRNGQIPNTVVRQILSKYGYNQLPDTVSSPQTGKTATGEKDIETTQLKKQIQELQRQIMILQQSRTSGAEEKPVQSSRETTASKRNSNNKTSKTNSEKSEKQNKTTGKSHLSDSNPTAP